MSDTDRDQALAEWAASEAAEIRADDPGVLRGDAARAASRALLERAGAGRPALDPNQPKGAVSPRRQVRLPDQLNAKVDAIARQQNRTPSAVMRDAIEAYVNTHKTSA